MSKRDVTIAARVPIALRTDLEAVLAELSRQGRRKVDGGELDLSAVLRIAAGELRDRVLGDRGTLAAMPARTGELAGPERRLADLDSLRPATHRNGPVTEKEAARAVWPRRNTQRRRVVELLEAAGNRGYTGDELDVELGVTYAGRRTLSELKRAGWVEVLLRPGAVPATRLTRAGHRAEVYVLTGAALLKLGEERRNG